MDKEGKTEIDRELSRLMERGEVCLVTKSEQLVNIMQLDFFFCEVISFVIDIGKGLLIR